MHANDANQCNYHRLIIRDIHVSIRRFVSGKNMNKKQKKVAVGVGVGLTALAAASAAGAYFFAGKHGAKNRVKVAKWAEAAKEDVLKEIKGLKKVTKQSYTATVDKVMEQYKKAKKVDPKELLAVAGELKNHWDAITKEVASTGKQVLPVVKRTVKKIVNKVAPAKKSAKRPSEKKTR